MHVLTTAEELAALDSPIFVPTMGALHAGHTSLIREAASIAGPTGRPVLVSIFVNPTQFGPSEDFSRYPRPLETDIRLADDAGADAVFAPQIEAIYPPGLEPAPPPLPAVAHEPRLEDAHRPGHFTGVCQVVARLFDLTRPAVAIFGEKDYQQLQVLDAMVRLIHASNPLRWPNLQIRSVATVRESDGLALSSRNAYLSPTERRDAIGLFRALTAAVKADTPASAERIMAEQLSLHSLEVGYAVARDAATLMPIDTFDAPARLLIAAKCGRTRLIDNMPAGEP